MNVQVKGTKFLPDPKGVRAYIGYASCYTMTLFFQYRLVQSYIQLITVESRFNELPALAEAIVYADDSTVIVTAPTWEEVDRATTRVESNMARYAAVNGLSLNETKTQRMFINRREDKGDRTLKILGIVLNKRMTFTDHESEVAAELRKRLGVVRRVAYTLPRGKLLNGIAKALIIGKAQTAAWVTRRAALEDEQTGADGCQVVINDLARLLMGKTRKDRMRTSNLLERTGMPSMNEITTRQAVVAAWQARKRDKSPLRELVTDTANAHYHTRSQEQGLLRPAAVSSVADSNIARVWNACPDLREAKDLNAAKKVARNLASAHRLKGI